MCGDPGVSAFPEGDNIFSWKGTITGSKDTAYEGMVYKLSLSFPSDYPFKPPKVKFETTCFHPNVDLYGNICLDILQVPKQIISIHNSLHGLFSFSICFPWILLHTCLCKYAKLCEVCIFIKKKKILLYIGVYATSHVFQRYICQKDIFFLSNQILIFLSLFFCVCFRINGHLHMMSEPFFFQFRVFWEVLH